MSKTSEAAPPAKEPRRRPFVISHDPETAPLGLERCVAIIGNFDGVHRGHAAVISRGLALAHRLGRPCAILTFEPHPADVFAGRSVIFRLTPEPAKALILKRLGLDGVIVLRFDVAFARISPEEFILDVLVKRLNVSAAVIGFDFHFGAGRRGDPALLANEGARLGFMVDVVEKVTADQGGSLEAVHSTAVRSALGSGDVVQAASLLGRPWFVLGEVLHGKKIGRELGFPTANLALDPSCRLKQGIYAVRVRVNDESRMHLGAASFGTRPTFGDGPPLLEIFLMNFSGDLYGRQLESEFIGWIRPELAFQSEASLITQIREDVRQATEILKNSKF